MFKELPEGKVINEYVINNIDDYAKLFGKIGWICSGDFIAYGCFHKLDDQNVFGGIQKDNLQCKYVIPGISQLHFIEDLEPLTFHEMGRNYANHFLAAKDVFFSHPYHKKSAGQRLADSMNEAFTVRKKQDEFDDVNRPSHYNSHPSGVECIEITQHHSFGVGNAIKYLWRQGLKDGESSVKDLKKAIWYIQNEIHLLDPEQDKPPGRS